MPQKILIEDLTDLRKEFEILNKAGLVTNKLADSFNKFQNSFAAFINLYNQLQNPVPPGTVELPWKDKAFIDKWNEYKLWRKERLGNNFTPIVESKKLKGLVKMSENDMERAIAALDHSMEQEWIGIFEKGKNRKKSIQPTEPESLNDINHDN